MLTFAIEASAPGGEVALGCDGPADAARLNVTFLARLPALTDATLPHVFETFARREALAERQGERPAACSRSRSASRARTAARSRRNRTRSRTAHARRSR